MRKFIVLASLIFVLTLTATSPLKAQQSTVNRPFSTTIAAADIAMVLTNSGVQYHQLVWTTTGSVPTCSVRLDQSDDGTTWTTQMIAAQNCAAPGHSALTTGVARFTRINVTTKTGAGTVTVVYQGFINSPSAIPIVFTTDPTGVACNPAQTAVFNGMFFVCQGGVFVPVGGGGIGIPGGIPNNIQYNNAGAFGGVTGLDGNEADCGDGSPCMLQTTSTGTFRYLMGGTNTAGPAGNFHGLYQFSDGGIYWDATNGTTSSNFGNSPTSNFFLNNIASGTLGYVSQPSFASINLSRYLIKMTAGQTPVTGDFVASGGWGNTATVAFDRGSDNNPTFTVTSAGTGQAADPTIAFTYHNGDFGATAQVWAGNCTVIGGTGARSPISVSSTGTVSTFTYNATPVAGLTYQLACFGAVAGAN